MDLASFYRALADSTRLRIVHLLTHQQLCVCQLMAALDISQAKASRHLAVLRQADIVSSYKQAQWVWYTLNNHPLLASEIFRELLAEIPGSGEDVLRMKNLDPGLLCITTNEEEC